jgi:uncharacterized lipoprotein YajG
MKAPSQNNGMKGLLLLIGLVVLTGCAQPPEGDPMKGQTPAAKTESETK